MAVRNPLYVSGGNLVAMTFGEIEEYRQKATFLYSQSPTAVLTVVSSSGALIDAMSDTRTQAGSASQSASAFVYASGTAEPSTVTVSYDKVNLAYTASGSVGHTTDTGTTFPVYYDNSTGAIRSMNLTDFLDTFIYPAVITMTSSTESAATAGTYTVTTSSTAASNYTNVSTTAIFTDTRANTSLYSAAGIPETLDQPTTITNYFLHRRDGTDNTPSRIPVYINSSNNLQEFAASDINTLVGDWLRFTAAHDTGGHKISYNIGTSGSGSVRGSTMTDTKLDGSGLYAQLQVNIDDYRSQEFPNGTAQNISLYNLRIHRS
tara:strand:+ start:234 stop:1190 length:957 start_codon:yes stop_codon:yes gene_type:complete